MPSIYFFCAFLVAQVVKNPPAMWETWVRALGLEDPLEESMATHPSALAWRIPTARIPLGILQAWPTTVRGVAESNKRD